MNSPQVIINELSPLIDQPPDIKIQLKQHQLAMIYEMNTLEKNGMIKLDDTDNYSYSFQTKFGCLCDKVGAGKSFTILGLISQNKTLTPEVQLSKYNLGLVNIYKVSKKFIPINILVVPMGIFNQWIKYVDKDTKLNIYPIRNTKDYESFIDLKKTFEEDKDIFNNYDLFLVSNTMYNKFCQVLELNEVSRLIIDEVDSIYIPNSKSINAQFTWFISSSKNILKNPNGNIDNYHSPNTNNELFGSGFSYLLEQKTHIGSIKHRGYIKNTLLSLVNKKITNRIYLNSDEDFINKSFNLPDYIVKTVECKNTKNHIILNGIIDKNIMEMINGGDIKGAMEMLGGKVNSQENIVKILTKKLQDELQNKKLEYEYKSNIIYVNEEIKLQTLEKIKTQIEKTQTKIDCIKKRIIDNNSCPICADDITNKVVVACCSNPFCFECISISLSYKPECPMCRTKIVKKDLILLGEEKKTNKKKIIKGDKFRDKLENFEIYFKKVMGKKK